MFDIIWLKKKKLDELNDFLMEDTGVIDEKGKEDINYRVGLTDLATLKGELSIMEAAIRLDKQHLISTLVEIELQRSELIKQLASCVISHQAELLEEDCGLDSISKQEDIAISAYSECLNKTKYLLFLSKTSPDTSKIN